MNRNIKPRSLEFKAAVTAIKALAAVADSEHCIAALTEAIEEKMKKEFAAKYGLTKAKVVDIQRLIQPSENKGKTYAAITPPHHDHNSMWLKNGTPYCFVIHVYDVSQRKIQDWIDYCAPRGLEFKIENGSFHYPGGAVCVVFRKKE